MATFVVETDMGVGLRTAPDLATARENAIRSEGTSHFRSAKVATDEDIFHIAAMGGWVPESDIQRLCLREPRCGC